MAKLYSRINWVNAPLTTTPVGATLLNKMDKGIDDLDNKIEEIYGYQNPTLLGTTTGNNTLVLPADFKELRVSVTNSATTDVYYFVIPNKLVVVGNVFRDGYYISSSNCGGLGINFETSGSNTLVKLGSSYKNGTANTTTATTTFYYV